MGIPFDPTHIMQDACQASYKAAKKIFKRVRVQMCYFHVRMNIRKHETYTRLHKKTQSLLEHFINRLHWSRDKIQCEKVYTKFNNKFGSNEYIKPFMAYLDQRSLDSPFRRWKIFNSPPGYACTNSPIESFNNVIKRDFVKRKKKNLLDFLHILKEIVVYYSVNKSLFSFEGKLNSKGKKAASKFTSKHYFDRLGRGDYKFFDEETNLTSMLNYKTNICDCKFYLKWKTCAHLHALNKLIRKEEFVKKAKLGRNAKISAWHSKN